MKILYSFPLAFREIFQLKKKYSEFVKDQVWKFQLGVISTSTTAIIKRSEQKYINLLYAEVTATDFFHK